jgi:hypothetical protein
MVNNVIGPIDKTTWRNLIDIKGSIKFLKEYVGLDFSEAIDKETKVYKETIKTLKDLKVA